MRRPRVNRIVSRLLFVIRKRPRAGNGRTGLLITPFTGSGAMNQTASVDRALDEMLVQLGGMVLRLSSPQVTRTPEERHALACSGHPYSVCCALSCGPA